MDGLIYRIIIRQNGEITNQILERCHFDTCQDRFNIIATFAQNILYNFKQELRFLETLASFPFVGLIKRWKRTSQAGLAEDSSEQTGIEQLRISW